MLTAQRQTGRAALSHGTACARVLAAHGCRNGDGAPQGCTQAGEEGNVARTLLAQASRPLVGTGDMLGHGAGRRWEGAGG